jgi:hypothetical protein
MLRMRGQIELCTRRGLKEHGECHRRRDRLADDRTGNDEERETVRRDTDKPPPQSCGMR